MMDMEDKLRRIEQALEPLLQQETVARSLFNEVPAGLIFVGLCGVELPEPSWDILPGFLILRRVTNPPGVVHVACAANLRRSDYLAVSRYSSGISAELAVGNAELGPERNAPGFLHGLAWHCAALLKLRASCPLFAPASATVSWDTIAARMNNDVVFTMLDDLPRRIRLPDAVASPSHSDLEWARAHFEAALRLRDFNASRRFGLAFNVAYTWNHTSDHRIALANLWVGIEALFGDRGDRPVTKKLAERVSFWLPGVAPQYVAALYNRRCDAVHGRWLENHDLVACIAKSWEILRSSLLHAIERESRPLPDWME